MNESLNLSSQEGLPPSRPPLARSYKSARLPSLEELNDICLKPTPQKRNCMPPLDLHDCISRVHPKGVVRERQWNAIQLRCQTHAEEATRLDRRGRSCLHAACAKKPPLNAIHSLVTASDDDILLKTDNHGRTPLAISISSNAPFEVIQFLLASEPKAAKKEDHLGRLPLHLACIGYDYGQKELVKMLLDANTQACIHETRNGRIPLVLAVEVGAPVEVITLLVKNCPESVEMSGCGMNSLFMAIHGGNLNVIQTLVGAWPKITSIRGASGAYPLRLAIERHSSSAVVECLCTSPDIVTDTDTHMENTALHAAFDNGQVPRGSVVSLLLKMAPQVSTLTCRSGHSPLTLACQKYTQLSGRKVSLWNIVAMLLLAAKYGNSYPDLTALLDQKAFVVHAAVSTLLPKEVVMNALYLYPDQAGLADCFGNYPFQLTLTSPYEGAKSDILLKLLDQYPEAATFRTQDGQSMLATAVMSLSVDARVIARLVQVQPETLRELNPVLNLYPFQLAALAKSSSATGSSVHPRIEKEWNKKVDQDLVQLSVIFVLLRAAPDLVVIGAAS